MTRSCLALLLSVAAHSGCGCTGDCASPEGVVVDPPTAVLGDDLLDVVTINLLHGWADDTNDATLDARLELVVDELAALRPHVVLVQEASVTPADRHCNVVASLRERLASATGDAWGSAHAHRSGSDVVSFFEGPGLLARVAFRDVEVLEYQVQQVFEHRVAVVAALDGGPMVVSTHLGHHDDDLHDGTLIRVLQARELAGRAAAMSSGAGARVAIVGGDLNDPPGSDTLRELTDQGGVDLWEEGAPDGAEQGTELVGAVDDAGATYARRIDHLIGFGGARATSCERMLDAPATVDGEPLWPSDHAGVWCTARVR